MKKFLPLITILGLFACSAPDSKTSTKDTVATDTTTKSTNSEETAVKPEEASSKWTFTEEEDKMTSKKSYFATIDANEELQFDFPYDGGSTASLLIRNKRGENNVMLQVSKGQFVAGVDGATLKIRMDNGPAQAYSASEASDGSSNVLFIESANKFIKKLKTAKKVLIEAEFYDAGNRVMEFDVDGFKWAH